MEFIKGKWYRNSEWRDNAYCKADGSNVHDKIYFTECIDDDNHTYKLDWWQNREGIMREVPLSEIQQYLPEGHPDKQCTSLIGRYVKWLNDASYDCFHAKGSYNKIIKVYETNVYLDSNPEFSFNSIEENTGILWELMPEGFNPTIEKWSVGSYVVFLEDKVGGNKYNRGEYQEIVDIDYSRFTKGAISYKEGAENDLKWEEAGKIRWFATKSEAEEFAKSLVEVKETKPKQLTIDDLVEGEIYKVTTGKFNIIHKFSKYNSSNNYATFKCFLRIEDKYYLSQASVLTNYPNYVWNNTTPQEKKHLNVCIQQDKFIPQDQLDLYDDVTFELKTFELKTVMKDKFYKGDYIVIISGRAGLREIKDNFCYKQLHNKEYLIAELNNLGFRDSAASCVSFDNTNDKWRYATPEEIAEYDRLGEPFDVRALLAKQPVKETLYETIVLNSAEELLACEKYFNNLGYRASSGHNSYSFKHKYLIIYHSLKEYQNLSNDCGNPRVTLEKYGITVNSEKQEPKYSYEVVHCVTQEEWDFIISQCQKGSQITKQSHLFNDYSKENPEGIAVCIKDASWCNLGFWIEQKAKIYSFQEFCNKFNHKPDFMSKKEPERKEPSMEELLEEARVKYPVGCTVMLLKGHDGATKEYTINYNTFNGCKEYTHPKQVISFSGCAGYFYYEGKWAEIISLPDKIEEDWIPKVGDWVWAKANTRDNIELAIYINKQKCYFKNSRGGNYDLDLCLSNIGIKKALPHEIPVQEDEFVLPEKWCFRVSRENYQKFKHIRELPNPEIGYITSMPWSNRLPWGLWGSNIYGTEITFEQFQKYVLNSTLGIKEYLITPQECISTTKSTDKQVCLSNFNEETKIKINFKQTIKI